MARGDPRGWRRTRKLATPLARDPTPGRGDPMAATASRAPGDTPPDPQGLRQHEGKGAPHIRPAALEPRAPLAAPRLSGPSRARSASRTTRPSSASSCSCYLAMDAWAGYSPQGAGTSATSGASWDGNLKGKGKGNNFGSSAPPGPSWDPPRNASSQALTSLGLLRARQDPAFEYLEWQYLWSLREYATREWPLLQGGTSEEAVRSWAWALRTLELDGDAALDLFLLAGTSVAGRAEANRILWDLLTDLGPRCEHRDLSCWTSAQVKRARRVVDRPPSWTSEWKVWTWRRALKTRRELWGFCSLWVPPEPPVLTGLGGVPLAPPDCWPTEAQGPEPQGGDSAWGSWGGGTSWESGEGGASGASGSSAPPAGSWAAQSRLKHRATYR